MRLHFEEGERAILAARLGLPDTADDTAVSAAVATWMQEDPATVAAAAAAREDEHGDGIQEGDDVVIVDVASFRRLRERERVAAEVEAATIIRDRNEIVEEAIHDGKFSPSRRDHYRERYDSDPEGTVALIGRLMPNTVPLEARGRDVPTDEVDDSAYPTEWVPEVAARVSSDSDGAHQQRRSRVHGE